MACQLRGVAFLLITDLTCEATEGTLTGETFNGVPIEGTDAVRMLSVNNAPVAVHDRVFATRGASIIVDVLSNDEDSDGDTLSIVGIGTPANGAAEINEDGTITYTPNAGFAGADVFSYFITDGEEMALSAVTVIVR